MQSRIWHRRSRMWQGMRASLPIALSVVPFGVAYGTVASQHMDYARAMLMSLVVFAGTAQFVTVSMIAQGVAYVPVLITGLLINLRLILLSAALAPHVRRAPTHAQPLLAQLLTDESFAVSIASFRRHGADWLFFAGSGVAIYATWQLSCLLGLSLGHSVPRQLGLEYALPASLICLLFLIVDDRKTLAVALTAGVLSLTLRPLLSNMWSALVATLLATGAGSLWGSGSLDSPCRS